MDGISLRVVYIHNIFVALYSNQHGGSSPKISFEEIAVYVEILETYCPNFLKKLSLEFWDLTKSENVNFNKFLMPPVKTCLRCSKSLAMRNYPAKVKLFTTEGPLPCSKITLECRNCSCVYGLYNYSDSAGSHYYPAEINIKLVEASNVTYVESKLYKWFPSLRYADMINSKKHCEA